MVSCESDAELQHSHLQPKELQADRIWGLGAAAREALGTQLSSRSFCMGAGLGHHGPAEDQLTKLCLFEEECGPWRDRG